MQKWMSSGQICSSPEGWHLYHWKKTKKLQLEKFLQRVSLQFDQFQTFIDDVLRFMMFDFTAMGKRSKAARLFYYSIRATGVRAAAKLKRRKTKLNFDRALLFTDNRLSDLVTSQSICAFCLKRIHTKNLPDVWKEWVDIFPVNCDNIGNDESAGGPDDQERWQKAESFHEPKHHGLMLKKF